MSDAPICQVALPTPFKSHGDRPTRLELFASVISLPLEFGSNEDVLECKMALTRCVHARACTHLPVFVFWTQRIALLILNLKKSFI